MKSKVAIVGSGNIGTDLMIKVMEMSKTLEMGVLVGIDPDSDGLARAAKLGVSITHKGLESLTRMNEWSDIRIVFDATSAKTHKANSDICARDGKTIVDLTPAAIGPYVVPVVNMDEHLGAPNINMVSCGGQDGCALARAALPGSQTVGVGRAVAGPRRAGGGEAGGVVARRALGPGLHLDLVIHQIQI